jgi:PAS domain S-box-containing protein
MKTTKKNEANISYLKTLLPTLLTIGLFIVATFVIVIPQFENIVMDRKREMIRELTNSTISMINNWHQLQMNGAISEEEAKQSAIQFIRSLRYGEELKDYFWVTDLYPNMVVHPYRPYLNGKELKSFEDSHGKKLFVEMVDTVKSSGEGYVDYMWQWKDDSLKIVPKLSYVKKFAPWNWVVGTGIYLEDVKEEISRLEKKIITISIIITALSALLILYIAFQNLKSEKRRKLAEDELKESRERYRMLVEASGEGLIMILENGQVFYNKTFYSMIGYNETENDSQLQDIFAVIPDSKVFDFVSMKRKGDSLTNERIETKLKKKNNELIDVLLDLSSISFMNNSGIVINVKDISVNKEIKEALDYTKGKYLALTNQISIGVFRITADKKSIFTEVNPALIEILGVKSPDEIFTKSLFDYFHDSNSIFLDQLLIEGIIKNKIVRIDKENGTISTVSVSAVLVKNTEGENQSIDGIIEDITEQQRSDKEREKLISDLQSSVLVLSQNITPYVKNLPGCGYTSTVFEAAKIMTDTKSNTILVKGNNSEEIGIITDHDIRARIISSGRDLNIPAYAIMTAPLASIKSTATIYDALILFREKQIRHLIVKDSADSVLGIIDTDDIFEASYSNYLFFIEKIENAEDELRLADYRNQLIQLLNGLIKNNVDLKTITKINSLIADSITKKIISFAVNGLGKPPCSFAFISMGSEGREEQTLLTDQDNAIIFDDVSESNYDAVHDYFNKLGEKISKSLNDAGYSFCKGGIMASNKKFCQPLTVWKKYFTNWITDANPQDLLDLKIFFDFRFVYGEKELSEQLHKHVNRLLNSCDTFFVYLADNLVRNELPDNTLKMKSAIDLKLVLLPVVDFARLYGLRHNLNTSNTLERLIFIHEKGIISDSLFNNIIIAYNLIMQKRLQNQSESITSSKQPENVVSPQSFSEIQMLIVKRYFDLLKEMKDKINLDFKGTLMR